MADHASHASSRHPTVQPIVAATEVAHTAHGATPATVAAALARAAIVTANGVMRHTNTLSEAVARATVASTAAVVATKATHTARNKAAAVARKAAPAARTATAPAMAATVAGIVVMERARPHAKVAMKGRQIEAQRGHTQLGKRRCK